jgi:hypothetical protein
VRAAAFFRADVKKKKPCAGKHHRIFTVCLFSALPAPAILWLYFLSRLGFGQFFFSVASMRRKTYAIFYVSLAEFPRRAIV